MILDIAVAVGIAVAVILLQRRARRLEEMHEGTVREMVDMSAHAVGVMIDKCRGADDEHAGITEFQSPTRHPPSAIAYGGGRSYGDGARGRPDQAAETATERMQTYRVEFGGRQRGRSQRARQAAAEPQTADPPPAPLPCTRGPHHGDFPGKGD